MADSYLLECFHDDRFIEWVQKNFGYELIEIEFFSVDELLDLWFTYCLNTSWRVYNGKEKS